MRSLLAAVLCLCALVSCSEQTYVLVLVDVDPSITAEITELSFSSSVTDGAEIFNSDSQVVSDGGKALSLPRSFVILANSWGKNGETVTIVVEARDAAGTIVARGRGQAAILSGEESSEQVLLRGPCTEATDCLAGQGFCENPHRCDCEGEDCLAGVCEPIAKDDGSDCTEYSCDELALTVVHQPIREGELCATSEEGVNLFCGKGLCKEPLCGDFIVDLAGGEECDEGADNSDTVSGACRLGCKRPSCGDGVVDTGPAFGIIYDEQCDEGADNVVVSDAASNDAVLGERCRQSVTLEGGAGVTLNCVAPSCGDGVLNGSERCDDHNSINGDGCNPSCSLLGSVSLLAGEAGGGGDADGQGSEARVRPVLDFAVGNGEVFFTSAGSPPPQVVRALTTATGAVETIAGTIGVSGDVNDIGTAAQFRSPQGLALIGSALYIADSGNHRIKRLDLTTMAVESVAGTGLQGIEDGPGATATLSAPRIIAARNDNELLFIEGGESCSLRHFNLTTEVVTTLLPSPPACVSTDTSFGLQAASMTMAGNERLYVADGNRIVEISFVNGANPLTDPPSATFANFAGDPQTSGNQNGTANGSGTVVRFSLPSGLADDGLLLYVADRDNNAIRQIHLGTRAVTTVATDIPLLDPRSIAVDGTSLLISEVQGSTILAATLGGAPPLALTPLLGRDQNPGNADDQNGDSVQDARFDQPRGLALLSSSPDALYVADQANTALRIVDLSSASPSVSTITTPFSASVARVQDIVGAADRLYASLNNAPGEVVSEMDAAGASIGIGTVEADVDSIQDVAILGNFAYAASKESAVIMRVDLQSGDAQIFAGSNNEKAVVDGSRFNAKFAAPVGLVVCGGDLYVAESNGGSIGSFDAHVIRKIDMTMDPAFVSTLAGFATDRGHVDGVGLDARFDGPTSLACDERDPENISLYVSETGTNLIRQIELKSGRVTTLAGNPYFAGSRDGIGLEAGFNKPEGLLFDPVSGDLFVCDQGENIIRRVQ